MIQRSALVCLLQVHLLLQRFLVRLYRLRIFHQRIGSTAQSELPSLPYLPLPHFPLSFSLGSGLSEELFFDLVDAFGFPAQHIAGSVPVGPVLALGMLQQVSQCIIGGVFVVGVIEIENVSIGVCVGVVGMLLDSA